MGKGCINGKLDDAKFSNPIPVIGLYITVGSAVCIFLMLFDIISAFWRNKARWLPCRLFSLNSLTLTLLAICSKIPVDLSTAMPGIYDQLAKLSGTTLICVSMSFFYPSLAEQSDSELLTNMAALAVLSVTVLVNICIQISTGVIYLFIVEHIIIMVCMCVLLHLLWSSTIYRNKGTRIYLDHNKDLLVKGLGSLLQRLKLCYLYGFDADPQLRVSKDVNVTMVGFFCSISVGSLVQGAFRSLIMKQIKTCPGKSEYEWSMKMIVMFQSPTILLGFFATIIRWFHYVYVPKTWYEEAQTNEADYINTKNPFLRPSVWSLTFYTVRAYVLFPIAFLLMLCFPVIFLSQPSSLICCVWLKNRYTWLRSRDESSVLTEYRHLVEGDDEKQLDKWIVHKGSRNMNRWMQESRSKGAEQLSILFSRTKPSPEFCTNQTLNDKYPDEMGFEVSCLSIVLLMKISDITFPSDLSQCLKNCVSEAYEIIDFVETRLKSQTFKGSAKSKLAESLFQRGSGFDCLLLKSHQTSNMERARLIFRELKGMMPPDLVAEEVGTIINVIIRQDHQTIQDLYNYIEQIFVDVLHMLLAQFPIAIFKELTESSAKEFEKRVAGVLKLLWRIELLEKQVDWLLPHHSGIKSLITPAAPASPAAPPDTAQGVSMDISIPPEGIQLQPYGVPAALPNDAQDVTMDVSTPTEGIQLQPYGIPASFPNDDQDVSMDISTPTEGIQLQPYGVPAAPPDDAQGVSMDVSTPTEVIELQPCARFSDPPNDPLGVAQEAPSAIEDAATPLSEIVVIQDELSTSP